MVLHHRTLIWRSLAWMLPFPLEPVLVIILVAGASLLLMKYFSYIHSFHHLIFELLWVAKFSLSLMGSTPPPSFHHIDHLSAPEQYGRPLYGDVFGVHQDEQPNYEVGLLLSMNKIMRLVYIEVLLYRCREITSLQYNLPKLPFLCSMPQSSAFLSTSLIVIITFYDYKEN